MPKPEVVAQHLVGFKPTHNEDGYFLKVWRLRADGTVERTNSRSRWMPYIAGETIPPTIVAAAEKHNIIIKPGRQLPWFSPRWRRNRREGTWSK